MKNNIDEEIPWVMESSAEASFEDWKHISVNINIRFICPIEL